MTGYSATELVGFEHEMLHDDPEALRRLRAWVGRARLAGEFEGEGNLIGKDGKVVEASWLLRPLVRSRGAMSHIVAVYRDVAERNRMQEAMMTAQRLDAAGRMAGGIAHDFNNLLSVINGYCQILSSKFSGNPEIMRDLDEILKAGNKATSLTRQLLALGRRQPLLLRTFDLGGFLRSNEDLLARVVGAAGRLELSLGGEPLPVKTDPDRMQQVLLNLVLNARDALRDDGFVHVSAVQQHVTRQQARGDLPIGDYIVLTVRDNGVGMDADTLAHIFEPFFTTKEADKGSGLGLALVYGIVRQSSGHIRVSSTLLVGSTFEIFLPLSLEKSESGELPAVPQEKSTPRGHETILLIESDVILRKMLSGMLASEGYHVLEALDQREAESLVSQGRDRVDLIIGTLSPVRSFRKLLGLLASRGGEPAIVCTAEDAGSCPTGEGRRLRHMPKPFALSELLKAVRELFDVRPKA